MTMSSNQGTGSNAAPVTAEELRMQILQKEMEKASAAEKAREVEKKKHSQFADDFLTGHMSDEELAMIRRLVLNAVNDGKFEAMVYSFPSSLCSDGGRAINSGHPDWPETLQGKAKAFFERYQSFAKPAGYKLKAMIINFPGGIPGDVGFFLNWAPEQT
jgi:hypothetical protein